MNMILNTYSRLLADISRQTGIHLDPPSDLDVNWVLIEAPKLDKQVLRCIESNWDQIPTFPSWLNPLWEAFIANKSDAGILKCIRILLVFCYKAEHAPSQEQISEAQKAFEETNLYCRVWAEHFERSGSPDAMFREARRLVGLVIQRADFINNLIPSHGPGAVFPSHSPSDKSKFTINTQINEYYPYDSNFNMVHNLGYSDLVSPPSCPHSEVVCKMVAVPKDSRGPRLICVHPKEAVWIQQGQRHVLERAIQRSPLTSKYINFDDQRINGDLALSSSLTREYTTIDMKEASDRISLELVRFLFGFVSKLFESTRATHVKLLDGSVSKLQMFAPMGNALTFPVESIVFWSLVRAGISTRYGQNCNDVYVFGDDIIVPSKFYDGAISGLIRAGLVPNESKTFRKGFFRESCGVDAYLGKDVTPYRLKIGGITSYPDAESACDLAKRLRIAGFCDTSAYIYSCVSRFVGARLSLTNNPDCQGIIEYTEYDFGTLLRFEPRVFYDSEFQLWCVPYRKLTRPNVVIKHHAWWHVQDSLLSLERKSQGWRLSKYGSPQYSERGLEYPSPRGERLIRGVSNLMLTKV
jgi:hypothetical protein